MELGHLPRTDGTQYRVFFNDGTSGLWKLPAHIQERNAERYFKGMVFRNHAALQTEITRDVVRIELPEKSLRFEGAQPK